MAKSEVKLKFDRYCAQLEKYGTTETIHSPNMALLRKKARKLLIELMKEEADHSHELNKLWSTGYYRPYQFFAQTSDSSVETSTFLTIFCGELHELLALSEKYAAQLNLFIGDLHRYMPDDEIQKTLASGFYARSIELDPRQGRAFFVFSTTRDDLKFAEKLRLLILAQLAEKSYDTDGKLMDLIRDNINCEEENPDKFLAEFINWALFQKVSKSESHKIGSKLSETFKLMIEKKSEADWPMIMSACRLASSLAMENAGFSRFMDCFDAISEIHLTLYSKNLTSIRSLFEAVAWISTVGNTFESLDMLKNEPYRMSISSFAKTIWSNLNDAVCNHLNNVFSSSSSSSSVSTFSDSESIAFLLHGPKLESLSILSSLVHQILSLKNPTMKKSDNNGETAFCRINQSSPRRLDIPIEAIIEKVDLSNREDWKPVYVIMDLNTIIKNINVAIKIWKMDDFICILPSTVLRQLDDLKTQNRSIRSVIRTLMELQLEGRIIMKKCEDERKCAERLVESVRKNSKDHEEIVGFICEHPDSEEQLEGVTFYKIDDFWKRCLD
uniref:PINc domain-containing protein n=1 Tax=Caenorhabditis japonica TaxID=281687 RepID=A0A8R1HIU6_CAEJA